MHACSWSHARGDFYLAKKNDERKARERELAKFG